MCNLYSMTKGPAAIRDLVKAMDDYTGNLEPLPAIFPDQVAPVVMNGGASFRRAIIPMRWGFPQPPLRPGAPPRRGYVTNVRNTASGWWKPYLRPEFRCLVPVTSFSEYDHRITPPTCTWFGLDETRPLFFFAGIWRSWEGTRGTKADPIEGNHLVFSFLTTAPNAVVAPVHPKAMPVLLLTEEDRETWLTGPVEAAMALQRPAPDDAVRVVAAGEKRDKTG